MKGHLQRIILSDWRPVTYGLQQGSVLGPLLCFVYLMSWMTMHLTLLVNLLDTKIGGIVDSAE